MIYRKRSDAERCGREAANRREAPSRFRGADGGHASLWPPYAVWSALGTESGIISMLVSLLLGALALYVIAGVVVALAFVTAGLAAVLPAGTTVTVGARILFLPGAAALWPLVLRRWLGSRGAR
jgi:hypothetical protein